MRLCAGEIMCWRDHVLRFLDVDFDLDFDFGGEF